MSEHHIDGPLQPGDPAPNIVLDAITRDGKISLDDFRGHSPILVGLFRGLHCPFCRRHLAAQAQIDSALREKGVESLVVVNTPIERARLYFRYHPLPNLLAAADPERTAHRAFGLPTLEFGGGRHRLAAQDRHEHRHEHAGRPAGRTARADESHGGG